MTILQPNLNPTQRELTIFGWAHLVFVVIGGGLFGWRWESLLIAETIWGIGGGITLIFYRVPPLRLVIYRGWVYVTYPIGVVMSLIILGAVYYLVMTPIGIAMRMCGRDPLNRRIDRTTNTYWTRRDPATDIKRYLRQF